MRLVRHHANILHFHTLFPFLSQFLPLDLQNHIDYIHYNPLKHGLVEDVADWVWSTYHKYVESGRYGNLDIEEMQKRMGDIFVGE